MRCPICGGSLDEINTDDGIVADDCACCVPRGLGDYAITFDEHDEDEEDQP
jgi:transcription initiation factor TFIIIB Brf1 subunit/transcription initiation factor TFIIB